MTDMRHSPVTEDILKRETITWPQALRERWIAAHHPDFGMLTWAPQTRHPVALAVSRYLRHVDPEHVEGDSCLLRPEFLRSFLTEAEKKAGTYRLYSYVHELMMAAGVLYPDDLASGDLSWLRITHARLRRRAESAPKQRFSRIIPVEDLVYVAESALQEALGLSPCEGYLRYRDGLFILLGLSVPERLRALASLRVDQVNLEESSLTFDGIQIKTKESKFWTLAPEVRDRLQEWLEVWRPSRIREIQHQVFLDKNGGNITSSSLARGMAKLTEEKLGEAATPHLLRHAAANSLLSHVPDRPALVSQLLGHRSAKTRKVYTKRAKAITAGRHARSAIQEAAESAAKSVRRETRCKVS